MLYPVFCILFSPPAWAADTIDTTALFQSNLKQDFVDVKASDLGIREPRILPGSVWYGMKEVWRRFTLAIKFSQAKKAQTLIQQANERLYEIRVLAQKKKTLTDKELQQALEKYLSDLNQAQELASQLKQADPKLGKLIQQEFARQRLFEILERQLSSRSLGTFKQESLQAYAKFLFQAGTDAGKEQLKKYVDENVQFDRQSIHDTHVLDRLKNILSDQLKQNAIAEARDYALEKITEHLKALDPEEQSEKIKEFLHTTTTPDVPLDPKTIIQRIIEEKERLDLEFQERISP